MKSTRWVFALGLVGVLLAAVWLWMERPQKTDMAAYAPSHALIYLESNSPVDIAQTIVSSDAWRALSPNVGKTDFTWLQRRWIREFVYYSGIGSAPTVILARSQVAVVMLDLGATEQDETLTIKPEVAILVETHTSERRVRTAVEETLRRFAEKAYKQPIFRGEESDGARFMLWTAPSGGRQIAALIDGSFVIIGNSEQVVKTCLDVRRGRRASLRGNPELEQMRLQLASERALAFGFVSSENAARLLALGAPLFFGSAAELRFDSILSSSAPKILTGLGWSSQPRNGGIEDRYVISLTPTFVSRLRQAFRATNADSQLWRILPKNIYSLTVYKFDEPAALWRTLESAVSSHLDTLSAVLFSSLLKSALLPYGIEDPEKFLPLVGPTLITLRESENSERAILIAQVRDEQKLRILLTAGDPKNSRVANNELFEIPGTRSTFSFSNGYLILGTKDAVRRLVGMTDNNRLTEEEWSARVARFGPPPKLAGSLTYTNESGRVRAFLSAIFRVQDSTSLIATPELERALAELPYSATDTTLSDHCLDRRTISSFGQFGAALPLLFPER